MRISKIGILASVDASKPTIIIEKLCKYHMLNGYEIVLFTVGTTGKCYDVCCREKIKVIPLVDANLSDSIDIEKIKKEECDLLISMGWPYLIPETILKLFGKAINCHGSILPDYRGSLAYMHYFANCEPFYGVSIHYMNEKFDDGKVLIQSGYKTLPNETNNDMQIRSAELCAFLLPTAIHLIEQDYEGYEPEGEKRYFFKRTPEEFIEYRMRNEELKANGKPLILTPYKRL